MYGVIYLITCIVNGMKYVGMTTNLEQRIIQHKGGNQFIDKEIQKYGWSEKTFKVDVLEECETLEQLSEREKYWIAFYNCIEPNGYNRTSGGEGGWKHTAKSRARMSTAQLGNKKCLGHHHKKETREKIAMARTGQHHTETACAKMSASKRAEIPYKNLSDAITAKQLSYTALAKLLNFSSVMTVSNKMRGIEHFTEKDVAKLVEIFGLPAEYLLERTDGLPTVLATRGKTPYKNLSNEMEKLQLSYKKLAKILGLEPNSVSLKMCGKIRFTVEDIAKLVEIFNLPAKYLMTRDDGKIFSTTKRRANSPFKNLLNEMKTRNFSYDVLAKLLGLSKSTVSHKMRGVVKFTARDIEKLVEIFGKPAEYLLERTD